MLAPAPTSRVSPPVRLNVDDNGCGPTPVADSRASPDASAVESPSKKRRMMLQTMGHQLREVGTGRDLSAPKHAIVTWPSSSSGNRSGPVFMRNVYSTLNAKNSEPIETPESDIVPGYHGDGDHDSHNHQHSQSTISSARYLWRQNEVAATNPNIPTSLSFENSKTWTQCTSTMGTRHIPLYTLPLC